MAAENPSNAGRSRAVLFRDHIGSLAPGVIFYPESLKRISVVLASLNSEEIKYPSYFNANIRFLLDLVMDYLKGIHDTHEAAKVIYERYRTEGHQFGLYLRNFHFGGMTLHIDSSPSDPRSWRSDVGFSGEDRGVMLFLRGVLGETMDVLSFVNDYEIYPPAEVGAGFVIPSFRVLSHNWLDIVSEAIRGAKLIVMNLGSGTEGIEVEMSAIRESGMVRRTVVLAGEAGSEHAAFLRDAYAVIELPHPSSGWEDGPEARRLRDCLERLSGDDFRQTRRVRDLSGLECHVVDKRIDLAKSQLAPELLAGIAYQDYLPSSLANNWHLLFDHFPQALAEWQALEAEVAAGGRPGVGELAGLMYLALVSFYLAVTLERYYEMAVSIAIVGTVHKAITGQIHVMADCCRHASVCAAWAGDLSLSKYYSDLPLKLGQKALDCEKP